MPICSSMRSSRHWPNFRPDALSCDANGSGVDLIVLCLPTIEGCMNPVIRSVVVAVMVASPAMVFAQQQQGKVAYPPTKTITHVDDYFGRKISDPYRWMEDLNAPAVAQWVKAENA